MAQLFNEVIQSEFSQCFKHIVFAIIEDHNSRNSLEEFSRALNTRPQELDGLEPASTNLKSAPSTESSSKEEE